MLMHPTLSKKINKKLQGLAELQDTEKFKETLNEDGSMNPHKFSLLPEVKEVIQFMVDNDVTIRDLHDNGFFTSAMLLDFSVIQNENTTNIVG